MTIENIFPLKIYKSTYDKVDYIKDVLFPKLEYLWKPSSGDNQQFMRDGTICSYHTSALIQHEFPEETKDLMEFALAAGKEFWKECDYYNGMEPVVAQVWANKTPKHGWVHSHIHLSIPFTALLYVDASPEQGNLVLENPLDFVLGAQPINYHKRIQFELEVPVKTGDFIIFPAFLRHKVLPNTIDTPRLVLGLNFMGTGHYWAEQWLLELPTTY